MATISVALGTERTRNELLAYILELLDDEEEVLLALTETLGGMLDNCGGPAHSEHLFRILEKLFAIEEQSVREKVSWLSFIFLGNRKHEENSCSNPDKRLRRPYYEYDSKTNEQRMLHNQVCRHLNDPDCLHLLLKSVLARANGDIQHCEPR